MAKKPANPGEPTPRRASPARRRTDKLAENRAVEIAGGIGTANDARPPAPTPMPSPEEIARRAYEIYASRGRSHGHDIQDWLQAERELRASTRTRTRAV